MLPLRVRSLSFFLLCATVLARAQTIEITPANPTGVYSAGQPISWNVSVKGDASALSNARYKLKLNGGPVIVAEVPLDLSKPGLRIEAQPLAESATLLVEVTATPSAPDAKPLKALGGAVVDPANIRPVVTRPADLDAFWKNQLAALASGQPTPVIP